MRLRKLAALIGAAALAFSAVGSVSATQPTHHKVTICHATSSETNPYTIPTVDIASAGYPDGSSGHAGHGRDGVWYPGAKADGFDWGDIIPPYDYGDFHFAGLNWTEAGQAIYNNDCNFPKEEHEPAIHVEKTPSVTTLPVGGGEVTYTYVVTNTGDVELSDVSVTDDKCAPVTYVSGDANDDELLDLAETWTFTCTTTITETTTNVATATGHDGDKTVHDTDDATVDVTPAPEVGSLEITKAVTDAPEGFTGTFKVHVDCGEDGTFNGTIDFPAPGSITIDDIPAGAECTVTETDASGAPAGFTWGTVVIDGSPATIEADGTAHVTVTNPLEVIPPPEFGSLTVTKEIPGVPEGFTGSFDVRVTCVGGFTADRTIAYPDPGFVTINDIPAGAECLVVELGKSAPPAGLSWGGSNINGPVTIAANQTAAITVTNLLSEQQAGETLGIAKSNNAPIIGGVHTAGVGASVTYTLNYTVTGTVHNAVLKDVLPVGVTYTNLTASSTGQLTFVNYDAGTRTLTWTGAMVDTNGSVTYQVTISAGAAAQVQPLTNTAKIHSDETAEVQATSNVFVPAPPLAETAPPTDVAGTVEGGTSGGSMLFILLGLAGLVLAVAFIVPTPAAIRKRR